MSELRSAGPSRRQNARLEASGRIVPQVFEPAAPPHRPPVMRRLQWAMLALLCGFVLLAAFLLSGTTVTVTTTPAASVDISGGWRGVLALRLHDGHLLLPGHYSVQAQATGYEPFATNIDVASGPAQRFNFSLTKLPGTMVVNSQPAGARLRVNGRTVGTTPARVKLRAGTYQLLFDADFFHPLVRRVQIVGLGQQQQINVKLAPASALLRLPTVPVGAEVRLGARVLGRSDSTVRVPAGDHLLVLKHPGYRAKGVAVTVVAGRNADFPLQQLERANGLVEVRSQPSDALIAVDGVFRGVAPLELSLEPGRSYTLSARKPGYTSSERNVTVASEHDVRVDLALAPEYGQVTVNVEPLDAELVVDGVVRGQVANVRQLRLDARVHVIEARKPGFLTQRTTIVPRAALAQSVNMQLLSIDEARRVSSAREIKTPAGHRLRLIYPGSFNMGSPPREPGHRSNEVLREVELTRAFYLGTHEVTNKEFRRFQAQHDAGDYQMINLNEDSLPASQISWNDAALYCNWLSQQDGLPPFYRMNGSVVSGYDAASTGYRLPTEAEWEYAARRSPDGFLRFPWGAQLPPPNRTGNYADRAAAALVGRILVNYLDGSVGPATVGRYKANAQGIYDMGGNVAEWTNDFYEVPAGTRVANPMGPASAQFHVIKGSTWLQGTATELRLAFRDFGKDRRVDVGFRIARFAE